MEDHLSDCVDSRGEEHLTGVMQDLKNAFGDIGFHVLIEELYMERPHPKNDGELDELVNKVNIQRLNNHPIKLSKDVIRDLYKEIMEIN